MKKVENDNLMKDFQLIFFTPFCNIVNFKAQKGYISVIVHKGEC